MNVSLTSVANHEARERLLQYEREHQDRMRGYEAGWIKAWKREARKARRAAAPFRRKAA